MSLSLPTPCTPACCSQHSAPACSRVLPHIGGDPFAGVLAFCSVVKLASTHLLAFVALSLASAVAGVSLNLERLVLVGFQLSPPDAQQGPVMWPGGLVSGSGEQLNMTDVRVVINSQELFNKYLTWFTASNTLLWTVSERESPPAAAVAHWCSSGPQLANTTDQPQAGRAKCHVA